MKITTERLLFRPYHDDDLDFLKSLLSNPDMMRYIGNGQVRDEEGAHKFLDRIYNFYQQNSNFGLMVLVEKDSHERVGHAGLVPQIIDRKEEIEIGYWISLEYWNRGFATEAALALKSYGKNQLGIEKLISLIQLGNIPSEHVAVKIGMNIEKEIILKGKRVNVYAC